MYHKESYLAKRNSAEILKGGILAEVGSIEHAKLAEEAGVKAVIVVDTLQTLDCSRMSYLELLKDVKKIMSIPVLGQCRPGHFVEAQILEAMKLNFIDECEDLASADESHHINKHKFRISFMGGASDFSSALRRIAEGAAVVRTACKSNEKGISDIVGMVRTLNQNIKRIVQMQEDELLSYATEIAAPIPLVLLVAELQRLPVPLVAAGGICQLADAVMLLQLGVDSILIDRRIYDTKVPLLSLKKMVQAQRHYREPEQLLKLSLEDPHAETIINVSDFTAKFLARLNPETFAAKDVMAEHEKK